MAVELREHNLAELERQVFDVLVVGGGINGAASAAALAARGAKVALIERGDFASATSQASSNLVWGGIKYLEGGEVGLVYRLCRARNELLRSYPSVIRELRFFTCIERGFRRSRWLVFLGAVLYWIIGFFFTKAPRLLSRGSIAREEPRVNTAALVGGLEYSDAYLKDNDARFVFGFVRDALDAGAAAANYVAATQAELRDGVWHCVIEDQCSGRSFTTRAKVLINACGPWADALNRLHGASTRSRHVFSKGVHLLVNRITKSDHVLAFFADDGRLFFVIPMGDKSSIGTTDTRVQQLPAVVTDDDRRFILDNVNKRLSLDAPLTMQDVIAERCGVRPLVVARSDGEHLGDDWASLSRKHVVESDVAQRRVTIFGGKLTDCVNVGDEICEAVQAMGLSLAPKTRWYGEPGPAERQRFLIAAKGIELDALTPEGFSEPLTQRFWRRYGLKATELLTELEAHPEQARAVFPGVELCRCEVTFMARHEMVTRLSDLLRRRTTVALSVRRAELADSSELRQVSQLLFGQEGEQRFDEYFEQDC